MYFKFLKTIEYLNLKPETETNYYFMLSDLIKVLDSVK